VIHPEVQKDEIPIEVSIIMIIAQATVSMIKTDISGTRNTPPPLIEL
jgi:hypothetical protein